MWQGARVPALNTHWEPIGPLPAAPGKHTMGAGLIQMAAKLTASFTGDHGACGPPTHSSNLCPQHLLSDGATPLTKGGGAGLDMALSSKF